MKSLKKQRGLSSLGWLMVLIIVGFILTCAFKMGPAYADNLWIRDALRSLTELQTGDKSWDQITNSEIRSHLSRYFTVNNIRGDAAKQIEIDRRREKVLVNINYEVRTPLFYNVSVVMSFDNQFDSSRPDECCTPASE